MDMTPIRGTAFVRLPYPAIVHCAPPEEANASSGVDTINFNIPGSGVHTIAPNSELPVITEGVIIDGYGQPGASPNTQTASALD